MNEFTVALNISLIVLIVCSVQSVTADDATLIGVDIIPTKDSELQVHLQVIIRDSQGQLVSVTESTSGWTTIALHGKTIPGIVMVDDKQVTTNLTDNVFNEEVEKEIDEEYKARRMKEEKKAIGAIKRNPKYFYTYAKTFSKSNKTPT